MKKKKETTNNVSESKAEKSTFPLDLEPMLATLAEAPAEDTGWMYEVKWDGYRALAYLQNGNVELRSRNNKSFNDKYYPVFDALKQWKVDAVVDGELVVVNKSGLPDFGDLQNWRSEADGHLAYYLFDILWLNGENLMHVPLKERRAILTSVLPGSDIIKHSENFEASASEFFSLADKLGLEGILAKKETSLYIPGTRSKEWLKIKTEKHQELVIGGYTKNEGTPKPFSALLLGIFEGGEFCFVTPVGTGWSRKLQDEIVAQLRPLLIPNCPAKVLPEYNKPSRFRPNPPHAEVTWVKPELVCEISYREKTKDGAIRHPSFRGLRPDKKVGEVVWENAVPVTTAESENNKLAKKKVLQKPGDKKPKTLLNPTEETQVKNIGGHELKFTNLGKVYWPAKFNTPKKDVTKRDMLNYYYQAAPFMLPYYKDKPQTLYRFPHGIEGEKFYQKDVKGKVPDWIKTFPYHSYADNRDKEFLVITSEESLLYVASLGCIEINPWSSRIQKPDNPDWCIIDLDPDKNTFEQVIEAACVTKKILDAIEVPSYCKTSGSTGLHIYIPFGAKYDYEDSKEFGRKIAKLVHAELPDFTSIERKISDRGGKMYIDFLQNRPQATVAGPYSLRPKPGAPVSMPLHWEEVKKGLAITDFTIFNAMDRLKEVGDIFLPVLGKGIDLKKALKNIDKF